MEHTGQLLNLNVEEAVKAVRIINDGDSDACWILRHIKRNRPNAMRVMNSLPPGGEVYFVVAKWPYSSMQSPVTAFPEAPVLRASGRPHTLTIVNPHPLPQKWESFTWGAWNPRSKPPKGTIPSDHHIVLEVSFDWATEFE